MPLTGVRKLRRSWYPDTLPVGLQSDPDNRGFWLKIKATEVGDPADRHGTIEFVARFRQQGRGQRLREVSRFERLNRLRVCVDGNLINTPARQRH